MKPGKHKRVCKKCKSNKAGFFNGHRWKHDSDHDLCSRCFRSISDRMAAKNIAKKSAPKYD